MAPVIRVVLLDGGDEGWRQSCARLVRAHGFRAKQVRAVNEALRYISANPTSLLIISIDTVSCSNRGMNIHALARTALQQGVPVLLVGDAQPPLLDAYWLVGAIEDAPVAFVRKADTHILISSANTLIAHASSPSHLRESGAVL